MNKYKAIDWFDDYAVRYETKDFTLSVNAKMGKTPNG